MTMRDLRELGEHLRAERSGSPDMQRQVEAAKQLFGGREMIVRDELERVLATGRNLPTTESVSAFLSASTVLLRDHGPALLEALGDAERLDWVIRNPIFRVIGRDNEHGWSVMNQSNGLSFVVRGLPTYRDAIDTARRGGG